MSEWLLDTTYILPYFGIDVKISKIRQLLREILLNHSNKILISSCSLIEGKWKSIREFRKTNNSELLVRANKALLAFGTGRYFKVVNSWFIPDASKFADELLKQGHNDYMDCWIAGTTKALKLKLVSEEQDLPKIIKNIPDWNDFEIYDWAGFIEEIKVGMIKE
ncbi:MAG: hypothetical protein ACXAC7_07215 [Candidatus Hodarchaeales archaeon]|jgi:hypothetical protein